MIVEDKGRSAARTRLLLTLVLSVAAFGFIAYRRLSTPRLPSPSGTVTQSASEDWARISLPANRCSLINNVWNKGAAGRGFQQQVFTETTDGNSPAYGWRWTAPSHLLARVVSQPQLVCGDKPWDQPLHLNSEFPFRVGTKRLTAKFEARVIASGVYNMAFTLWAVSALPPSRSGITHEIMIWTAVNGQRPGGTSRGSTTIGGSSYSVYVEENHADDSGASTNRWTYVAFVPEKAKLSGELDVSAFLDYLSAQRILSPYHYITSLEFGNEVSEGRGVVEIRDFLLSFANTDALGKMSVTVAQ